MASAIQLSYVDAAGALQVLELDAFLSEQHQHSAEATQFPVEIGVVISDHVIQKPDVVRLEVIVSDTPTPSSVGLDPETMRQLASAGEYRNRSAGLYRKVVELKESATLVLLTSTVHAYDNMVIEAVDLPVDASTGDAARFTVSLRHVQMVGLKTVPVPKIEKAGPRVSKGKQATTVADPKPDSAARALKKALVGG